MMLVHHSGARSYLFTALGAAPDLVSTLLRGLTEEEADFRPAPERFTIRESLAHLADWDDIFLARIKQTIEEDMPHLIDVDEGQGSLDFGYAKSDTAEQMQLLHARRAQMSEFLGALAPQQWEKVSFHPRVGHVTVEALATLVPLHDAYHLRQIMDWRKAFALYQSVLD